jgi:hypothetical protein
LIFGIQDFSLKFLKFFKFLTFIFNFFKLNLYSTKNQKENKNLILCVLSGEKSTMKELDNRTLLGLDYTIVFIFCQENNLIKKNQCDRQLELGCMVLRHSKMYDFKEQKD